VNTEIIKSLQNGRVKRMAALDNKKHRQDSGLFAAHGLHQVRAGLAQTAYAPDMLAFVADALRSDKAVKQIHATVLERDIPHFLIDDAIAKKISGRDNFPPVFASFRQVWGDAAAMSTQPPRAAVALDRIRDPGNLGTMMRTLHAAGITDLIVIGDGCDPFGPECVQASMGSIFAMRLYKMSDADFCRQMKTWPGAIIGADAKGSDYRKLAAKPPMILVMGSEADGLSPTIAKSCTHQVSIAMPGGAESLNVGVALGILVYGVFNI
jgi:RNA methyltransferase, TrmH family